MNTLPSHLGKNHATGLNKDQAIAQFEIGNHKNFIYLILCWRTKTATVVDPQMDVRVFLDPLEAHGFKLNQVLLTHTHFDHIAGIPDLIRLMPELPIFVHPLDEHRLKVPKTELRPLSNGLMITTGDLSIQVLHTPGHSPGECCFLLNNPRPYLLTGDTLFIRDCGRTDLPGGSNPDMLCSLNRIRALSPETIILPGHHYQPECASLLGQEITQNKPLNCNTVEELMAIP